MKTIPSIRLLARRFARWLNSEAFGQHGEQSKALRKHAAALCHYAERYRYDSDAPRHIERECRAVTGIIDALRKETGHDHFNAWGIKCLADGCEEMRTFNIPAAKLCLDEASRFLRKPDPDEYDGIEDDSAGGRY